MNSYEIETSVIDGSTVATMLLFLYPGEVMSLPMQSCIFASYLIAAVWRDPQRAAGSPSLYFKSLYSAAISMHSLPVLEIFEAALTLIELLLHSIAAVHPVYKVPKASRTFNTDNIAYDTSLEFDPTLLRDCSVPGDVTWMNEVSKLLAVHYHKSCKYFNKSCIENPVKKTKEISCFAERMTHLFSCVSNSSCTPDDASAWFNEVNKVKHDLTTWLSILYGDEVHYLLSRFKNDVSYCDDDAVHGVNARIAAHAPRAHPLSRPVSTSDNGTDLSTRPSDPMAVTSDHCSALLNLPLTLTSGALTFVPVSSEGRLNGVMDKNCGVQRDSNI